MSKFINVGGKIIEELQPIISAHNRSFQYGDGFFETMRFANGQLLFLESHFERIEKTAELLKISLPDYFTSTYLKEQITKTTESNDISQNARVKIIFYRNGKGKYQPEQNDAQWIIYASPLYRPDYHCNNEGLKITLFDSIRKPCDYLANCKTNSALVYIMAALFQQETKVDECIVLNTYGNVADTIYANIFLVKDEKIVTPDLSQGCVAGIMRKQIISLGKKLGWKIIEQPLTLLDVKQADEIFLTNAIKGISWVSNFDGKLYKNEKCGVLSESLNQSIVYKYY